MPWNPTYPIVRSAIVTSGALTETATPTCPSVMPAPRRTTFDGSPLAPRMTTPGVCTSSVRSSMYSPSARRIVVAPRAPSTARYNSDTDRTCRTATVDGGVQPQRWQAADGAAADAVFDDAGCCEATDSHIATVHSMTNDPTQRRTSRDLDIFRGSPAARARGSAGPAAGSCDPSALSACRRPSGARRSRGGCPCRATRG